MRCGAAVRALIGLGANLGERERQIEGALDALSALGRLAARSRLYEYPALLPPGDRRPQPPYLNAVALLVTDLAPLRLLGALQAIERRFGRDRRREGGRWRPRPLDLDLLAVEGLVVETPRLVLPHPRMHERPFVLRPLLEVWPGWVHPRLGLDVPALLARLPG